MQISGPELVSEARGGRTQLSGFLDKLYSGKSLT